MTKRIQAYFRTEDEAEGARISLLPYNTETVDIGPLTDPLNRENRNILLPLVPLNNGAMPGGTFGTYGTTASGGPVGIVPGVAAAAADNLNGTDNRTEDHFAENPLDDRDLDDLHYVMELKIDDINYFEVIDILRNKHAYVEVFE